MKAVIYYSNGKQYTVKGHTIDVRSNNYVATIMVDSYVRKISNVVNISSRDVIEINLTDLLGVSLVEENGMVTSIPFSKRFKTVNFT